MILFDTGPLAALVNARDEAHGRARALLAAALGGRFGALVSTDWVLDEGLTLLQVRTGDRRAGDAFARLFFGARDRSEAPLQMRTTSRDIVEEAVELHFREYDRRLSLTDCTLVVHARRLDATVATTDGALAGLVPVVAW